MWGKSQNQKFNTAKIDTLVGKNTAISGDVSFSGGLHVEGKVCGNVQSDDDSAILVLSENGIIEGEVRVPNMVLNGTVEGDVHASERVELAIKSRVTGNVYYNLIEMAMGAEVNGNLVHRKGGKPQLEFKGKEGAKAKSGEEASTQQRQAGANS